MNSWDLLEAMKSGAVVKERWRRWTFTPKGKHLALKYPDGNQIMIQHSLLKPLFKSNRIVSICRPSGLYEYRLREEN